MKTLKVLLQEVVSGIKAWVNSNFAQESNAVHKTGDETVNGVKTFSEGKIVMGATSFAREQKGSTTYEMTASDFYNKLGFFKITQFKADSTSAPRGNNGDYDLIGMSSNAGYGTYLCTTPRNDLLWYGKFWDSVWQGWKEVVNCESNQTITGEKTFQRYVSVYSNNLTYGTNPSENAYCTFGFKDSGGITTARILRWVNSDGYNGLTMQCWDAQVTTDKSIYFQLAFDTQGDGYAKFGGTNAESTVGFIPVMDNSVGLGTTTNRWKTINGVNPGALSLPKTANSNLDTTNWNLRGGTICSFIPSYDGFINVQIKRYVDFSVWAISAGRQNFRSSFMPDGSYAVMVWFPCRAGSTFQIYSVPLIDSPAEQREDDLIIQVAKIWPAEGNV